MRCSRTSIFIAVGSSASAANCSPIGPGYSAVIHHARSCVGAGAGVAAVGKQQEQAEASHDCQRDRSGAGGPASSPRITTPSPSENTGRNYLERITARLPSLITGHLLDRGTERDRQRKRGGVAVVLDRFDGLAPHPHRLRQLPPGPCPAGPAARTWFSPRPTGRPARPSRWVRQRRYLPGRGNDRGDPPSGKTGVQLPCRIASTTELTATKAGASQLDSPIIVNSACRWRLGLRLRQTA